MKISMDQHFQPGAADGQINKQALSTYFRKGSWNEHAAYGRNEDLLIWITRGQGRMTIEGIPKGVGVFNAVFLPAGTPFSLEMINTFGQVISFGPKSDVSLPSEPRFLKIWNTSAQQEFASLLDALHTELTSVRPGAEHAVSAYGKLIGVWLERQIIADIFAPKPTASELLVMRYSRMIEEQHGSGWNTGDYAEELGVTLTHLSRTCKQVSGKTAGSLLNQRVLLAAKERLLKSDVPVAKISEELGFSTPGNFSRMFQKHTGRSPSYFRQSTKNT